uniref:Uncharacterized protein n=1 Tax=Heterosigma akashiwo TaxID=2829 RepID=A0A7S4DJJ5_HETAK
MEVEGKSTDIGHPLAQSKSSEGTTRAAKSSPSSRRGLQTLRLPPDGPLNHQSAHILDYQQQLNPEPSAPTSLDDLQSPISTAVGALSLRQRENQLYSISAGTCIADEKKKLEKISDAREPTRVVQPSRSRSSRKLLRDDWGVDSRSSLVNENQEDIPLSYGLYNDGRSYSNINILPSSSSNNDSYQRKSYGNEISSSSSWRSRRKTPPPSNYFTAFEEPAAETQILNTISRSIKEPKQEAATVSERDREDYYGCRYKRSSSAARGRKSDLGSSRGTLDGREEKSTRSGGNRNSNYNTPSAAWR